MIQKDCKTQDLASSHFTLKYGSIDQEDSVQSHGTGIAWSLVTNQSQQVSLDAA
jgi:hypothetical protein